MLKGRLHFSLEIIITYFPLFIMIPPPIIIGVKEIRHVNTYQIIFLGIPFKGKIGFCNALILCFGSEINNGCVIFKSILPTSFIILPCTLGHKNDGYFSVSLV